MNHPIFHFTAIELRSLARNKDVLFGTFIFPLILALILGVAFHNKDDRAPVYTVATVGEGQEQLAQMVNAHPNLETRSFASREAASQAIRGGEASLLLAYEGSGTARKAATTYDPQLKDATYVNTLVHNAIQEAAGRKDVTTIESRVVTEKGNRYVDFLFPGLLSLILMSVSLGHISNIIVQQRAKGLLRIYAITPLRKSHYFLSWFLSQLILHSFLLAFYLTVAHFLFDVEIRGNIVQIWGLASFGAFCFGMIGIAIVSRTKRVEFVGSLVSMFTLPMYLLSGVFFSSVNFPDLIQPIIKILPLTPFVEAMRGMMIDGIALSNYTTNLMILAVWGLIGMAVSTKLFRFS